MYKNVSALLCTLMNDDLTSFLTLSLVSNQVTLSVRLCYSVSVNGATPITTPGNVIDGYYTGDGCDASKERREDKERRLLKTV